MSSATSLSFGVNDTAVRTTLAAGITSTDTSVDVGEVTNPPALPFLIAVFVDQSPLREDDMEIMEVTGISGTTLTVTRGAKGTTAQSFSLGDKVFMGIVPSDAFDQVGASRSEIQSAAGTREIRQSLNELSFSIAESQFNQNLERLSYDGGLFHVFEDKRDVAGNTSGLPFNGSVGPFAGDLQTTPTTLTDSQSAVFNVEVGPNNRIAVGSDDNNVYIYDSTLNLTSTLTDAAGRIYGTSFAPNGRLAVGSFDNNVYVYDSTLNLINTLTDSGNDVYAVEFAPDGRLAVGSDDNNVYVYDSNLNLTNTLNDSGNRVFGVAFAPNNRLAVGSVDNNVYVYDSNLNLINTLTYAADFVREVAFGPNGRLSVGSDDGNAYTYDSTLSLRNIFGETDPGASVYGVAFSPSGELAVGSNDNKTYFNDSNLNLQKTLTDSGNSVRSVAFGPTGRLVVGSNDTKTYVYDRIGYEINVSFSDLDLSADGFSSPPADAVIAHDFTPDTDGSHAIEYTVADQSGNSVVISESQVGDIVDVSSLQDTTLSIQVDVTDSDLNASLDDFAIHFNE